MICFQVQSEGLFERFMLGLQLRNALFFFAVCLAACCWIAWSLLIGFAGRPAEKALVVHARHKAEMYGLGFWISFGHKQHEFVRNIS